MWLPPCPQYVATAKLNVALTSGHEGHPQVRQRAQGRSEKIQERAVKPITADTLLLIATNSMLLTEHFPLSEEMWEDRSKDENDWAA